MKTTHALKNIHMSGFELAIAIFASTPVTYLRRLVYEKM